jgi:hypothetical protein
MSTREDSSCHLTGEMENKKGAQSYIPATTIVNGFFHARCRKNYLSSRNVKLNIHNELDWMSDNEENYDRARKNKIKTGDILMENLLKLKFLVSNIN